MGGFLEILNANIVVTNTIEINNIPTPKCAATKITCGFKSITNVSRIIGTITDIVAMELVILTLESEFLLMIQVTIVVIVNALAVIATSP